MAMADTTSPSPLSSDKPRRSSGASSTRAMSRMRTGVPPSAFTTRSPMSAAPRRRPLPRTMYSVSVISTTRPPTSRLESRITCDTRERGMP